MRILLIGFGSVGRALASLIESRRDNLSRELGLSPRLVGVVDSAGAAASSSGLSADALIKAKDSTGSVGNTPAAGRGRIDPDRFIHECAADVLVEASPSVVTNPAPAFNHLKAAFASGKHVVTVNKAPLALAMPDLVELARASRTQFRYSGTVGAGTPVLATARTLCSGDRITRVRAVINGTTNFILWRMCDQGESYAAALAEAIRRGYAETDPSNDIDGIDTAVKVVILANTILGVGRPGAAPSAAAHLILQDVRISGIRDIPHSRTAEAAANKRSIKLIGEIDVDAARRNQPALTVSPQEVDRHSPLNVPDCLNAVQFSLADAGEVTLIGRGAGGHETATAILRDIVDIWNSTPH